MNLNHESKIVTKPWGTEIWECLSKDFCVKTIKLLKGYKTSYQFHRQKEEVNFVRSGEAELWLEDENGEVKKHVIKSGDSFFVPVTRKHRVIALTDLEMFEVSNEFVDDVVRIEDEFGRSDGKIEAEHQTPAVLILAAGLGSRLKQLTKTRNKALILIGNKAVISHIIEKFPVAYEIVVAVGYQKESLIEYCQLAHPERKFRFVEVDGWEDPKTDPGHSAWCCKEFLQRPFYLNAVDSLIEGPLPHMDGNWLGVYPTDSSEKYATVNVDRGNVVKMVNKGPVGFYDAFIGVAAVYHYSIFWHRLGCTSHNLIEAWGDCPMIFGLKAKQLRWFDAGNLDDLRAAREHFGETPLNSPKTGDETVYRVGNRVIKFHPDKTVNQNRLKRAKKLELLDLVPENVTGTDYFMAYDWVEGQNLYHHGAAGHEAFLRHLEWVIRHSTTWTAQGLVRNFYVNKTAQRMHLFSDRFGESYLEVGRNINGVPCLSLNSLLNTHVDFISLENNLFYDAFHGDLHFDNVIYEEKTDCFVYVDWRDSFEGETEGGDLYYDLGKLYGGTLIPFELLKDDTKVVLSEGSSTVTYSYDIPQTLRDFKRVYENWLAVQGYDLKRVKLIAALAFINSAPLHSDIWAKVLWFKGIELLHETLG